MKNIATYNVRELSKNEIKNTNGGDWRFVFMLAAAIINDCMNNPEDVEAGFNSTYNGNAGSNFI